MNAERKITTDLAQVTIRTDRLELRPLRVSDRGLIELYAGQRDVADMTRALPHPLPPGAVEALIERANAPDGGEDVWAIDGTPAALPEVLGLVTLTRMDREQSEVTTWIAPAFWSMGLATEALTGLLEANPHDNATLFGEVFQDNAASAKVLRKCGFHYLGDAEAFSAARGAVVNTWTYMRRMR